MPKYESISELVEEAFFSKVFEFGFKGLVQFGKGLDYVDEHYSSLEDYLRGTVYELHCRLTKLRKQFVPSEKKAYLAELEELKEQEELCNLIDIWGKAPDVRSFYEPIHSFRPAGVSGGYNFNNFCETLEEAVKLTQARTHGWVYVDRTFTLVPVDPEPEGKIKTTRWGKSIVVDGVTYVASARKDRFVWEEPSFKLAISDYDRVVGNLADSRISKVIDPLDEFLAKSDLFKEDEENETAESAESLEELSKEAVLEEMGALIDEENIKAFIAEEEEMKAFIAENEEAIEEAILAKLPKLTIPELTSDPDSDLTN
jgi:hypothetical protein